MLRSDLCDYSDAYIVVKGDITLEGDNDANKRNKNLAFKNNAPFINCISKINGVKIDNAEDLDVVMPMYNLLKYSKNCRKTTGSLRNYYKDEPSDPLSSNSESFKYKTSITGNNCNVGAGEAGYDANKVGKNETEIFIPLKHLSNFLKSLNIPLINCEVELILTWPKNCVLADMTVRDAQDDNPAIVAPLGLEFQITGTKLFAPAVTLSKENDAKLLQHLKTEFKRTAFTNVNRLFVLSFTRDNAGDNRDSFSDYYVPNVEIKDFNVLIDRKSFFDLPVKNEEEAYEN